MRAIKKWCCVALSFLLVFSAGCNGCKNKKKDSSDLEETTEHENVIGDEVGALCENGNIGYDIVIPADAGDCIRYAAQELVTFVQEATGTTLSVKEDVEALNNALPYVSLGNTAQLSSEELDIDYDPLKTDGFVMQSADDNVYITGNSERAVLYGVYEFLELFVGVKFLTYDYTYVPTLTKVPVHEMNIIEIPAFDNRSYLSNQLMFNSAFAARMRMNNEYISMNNKMPDKHGGKIEQGILEDDVHNTLYYVFGHTNRNEYISEPYYLAHPDWFFVDDGIVKDICFSKVGLTEDGQIDQSLSDSLVKIFVERLKEFVLRDTHAKYFMLGQEDYIDTCNCSECQRQEALYGRSGMLVRFVNAVANEIKAWKEQEGIDREINIVTFAYYYSQRAPITAEGTPLHPTVVPADNVFIRLAPITAYGYFGVADERQATAVQTMFADWSKITDRFWVWTYHTCYGSYFVYYPTMQHWQEDLQMFASMNTTYVLMQSAYSENVMWTNHMETYVASKMLWNPDRSAEELKKEFISYYYAGFDDLITEFIDRLDVQYAINICGDEIAESERPLAGIGGQDVLMNPTLYTTAFWEGLFELLNLADARIDKMNLGELEKKELHSRVAAVRLTPQFMVAMKYDFYYSGDVFGRKEFLQEFFTNCSELGVGMYSEGGSIDALKTLLGYSG